MITARRRHLSRAATTDQHGRRAMLTNRRPALLLCAVLVLTAACTPAAKKPAAAPPSAAPASSTVAVPADPAGPSGSAAASSNRPSTTPSTAAPVQSKPSSLPASPADAGPIDGPDGCPSASLSVAALRASGAAEHQYAFLQFTNKSAKTCSLTGFPGVQLVKAGAPLGKPAARTSTAVTKVWLAPGRSATAQLVDSSTCNADNSDSVAIYPPNRTERVVVPLSVRGCALSIDPVVTG
ncbi:MAG: hypothetical protein QOI26_407 [Pseudonocardiales bacterium]|jgi:hypothetical protein|nr:hypothetical protein [Pseudonocardiales bacterium]